VGVGAGPAVEGEVAAVQPSAAPIAAKPIEIKVRFKKPPAKKVGDRKSGRRRRNSTFPRVPV
jgi:hypothetical protein